MVVAVEGLTSGTGPARPFSKVEADMVLSVEIVYGRGSVGSRRGSGAPRVRRGEEFGTLVSCAISSHVGLLRERLLSEKGVL